jgi:uracil-DNA glycosylase
MKKKISEIDKLYEDATKCKARKGCYSNGSMKIFVPKPDEGFGRKKVDILFINERPGPETRKSGKVSPCNDDPTAKRFRELLKPLRICKQKYFSTNACLCLPNKDCANNKAPSVKQVRNCSELLKKQIEMLNPKLIVPLGNWGRKALCYCLEEQETLKELKKFRLGKHIRKKHFKFDKFIVYPLYHTSLRTLGRRSEQKQKKDWEKIKVLLKNL